MAIVATIPVQVEQAELERIRHREIQSLSAYEHCLRGREHQRSIAHASHAKALEHFSRALEQDPTSAAAHCGLAVCYVSTGGITPGEEDRRRERAISHAQQAIALDPLDPQGHWLLGMLLQMRRDFAGARFHLDRAMTLSPGDVETLGYTGWNMPMRVSPSAASGRRSKPSGSTRTFRRYPPSRSARPASSAAGTRRRCSGSGRRRTGSPPTVAGWPQRRRMRDAWTKRPCMPGGCAPRCNNVWARRSCGRWAARSGGSGCQPGFSMRPTWSTTSAAWRWQGWDERADARAERKSSQRAQAGRSRFAQLLFDSASIP